MTEQNTKRFVLRVCGSYAADGTPYAPNNIRYQLLKSQVDSWKDLLAEGEDPIIQFEEGSLRIVFMLAAAAYAALTADIDTLLQGRTEGLNLPSRLKWYKKISTEAQNGIEYRLERADGTEIATINRENSSKLRKTTTRSYLLDMETELEGIVVDAGGQGKPNIHMETRRGKYTVSATREQLSKIEGNILYKQIRLAVACKYDLTANTTRDYVLKDIVELSDDIEEEAVNAVIAHGTEVWKDVEDPYKWLAEMRGEEL